MWAVGDAAQIVDMPLPSTAQGGWTAAITSQKASIDFCSGIVAAQKAKYVTRKLNKLVKGKDVQKPFAFENKGSLAYIGNW